MGYILGQLKFYSILVNQGSEINENFCMKKCEFFFNNFDDFFDEKILIKREKIISKYYIEGDVHFNSLGNEKIFQNFERIFRK